HVRDGHDPGERRHRVPQVLPPVAEVAAERQVGPHRPGARRVMRTPDVARSTGTGGRTLRMATVTSTTFESDSTVSAMRCARRSGSWWPSPMLTRSAATVAAP